MEAMTTSEARPEADSEAESEAGAASILGDAHMILRKDFGFHLATLQIETTCLDKDHAKELDYLNLNVLID